MPMYSPRTYSGATPATFEAPTNYPPEWPPFPPPLAVEYPAPNMLQSPPVGHALPLAVQPPMGVTNLPAQQHAPPFYQHPGQPPQYQTHVPASEVTRTTAAGYELLANKLSEPSKSSKSLRKGGNLVPMYRKFENLNHRVLLHLQDEVCELEDELRVLDENIMQMSPRDEAGHAFPASRRGDARYGGELHYKRTELLGRIFQKLGQYSKSRATGPLLTRPRYTPNWAADATSTPIRDEELTRDRPSLDLIQQPTERSRPCQCGGYSGLSSLDGKASTDRLCRDTVSRAQE
jgi:hypothetical protein